jgi:mono/diheme cytochrome c family protein
MNLLKQIVVVLASSLVIAACAETPAPAPPPPTTTSISSSTVYIPNPEQGQTAWKEAQCSACHGPQGLGGIGPQLASTKLSYDQFLHIVRTAIPPKPAYTFEQLPDQTVYDIYAWVRTQIPPAQLAGPGVAPVTTEPPSLEDMRSMTIWTCRSCDSCHGVFAQGGPDGPMLAGINDPVEDELARMRRSADKIPEHSADHISDEIFEKLYEWLKMGCVRDECYQ